MLPEYVLSHHLPPPARPHQLTVNRKGRAYLSKALASQLDLRPGQAIDLLPPSAECSSWQLDLCPTAGHRLCWYADTRPRLYGVRLPTGLLEPGQLLTLMLAVDARPGLSCYPLAVALAADYT